MTAIYITDSEAVLQVRHGTLQVFQQHTLYISVPLERVSQILVLGRCHLKQEVASLVAFRRIPILFLLDSGREIIGSTPPFQRRTKYQNQQLRRAREPEFSQTTAESIVRAYLHNCCIVLQRLPREGCVTSIEAAERALSLLIDDLPMAGSLEDLWDYQAMAARFYYPALGSSLGREFCSLQIYRCVPNEAINRLLELGYALLEGTLYTFVEAAGLAPQLGHLHDSGQYDTPLVRDLMLEWQPLLVDELVTGLANSRVLTADDFRPTNGRGCADLSPEVLKIFLHHWEEKLQTDATHPRAGKISLRCALEWQVKEYVAALLGDVADYRPFLLRQDAIPLATYTNERQTLQPTVLAHL